jgi:glutathione S-transferase
MSYFSAKVRPALRAKGVHFVELAPTQQAYREVILPRTGLAFIPIVVTPEDDTWQDTSEILDALEARFPARPLYPATPAQRVAAFLLELYADEFLVLPAMHYRWGFPESEAKARADFAASGGDPETAKKFADRMSGSLRALGVVPASAHAIEAHLSELLHALSAHFAEHPFLLGGRPSLADCALMGPLYAHLYLDAVPGRLLRETAPLVCAWIERMNRPDPNALGAWLADDALAPTLRRVLSLVGHDAVPLLLDGIRALEAWAAATEPLPEEPPRAVGMHETHLRGAAFQRYTSPYALWMLQRPQDAYRAFDEAGRAAVDRALAGTGCESALAHASPLRAGKRRFRIVLQRAR